MGKEQRSPNGHTSIPSGANASEVKTDTPLVLDERVRVDFPESTIFLKAVDQFVEEFRQKDRSGKPPNQDTIDLILFAMAADARPGISLAVVTRAYQSRNITPDRAQEIVYYLNQGLLGFAAKPYFERCKEIAAELQEKERQALEIRRKKMSPESQEFLRLLQNDLKTFPNSTYDERAARISFITNKTITKGQVSMMLSRKRKIDPENFGTKKKLPKTERFRQIRKALQELRIQRVQSKDELMQVARLIGLSIIRTRPLLRELEQLKEQK